MATPAQEMLAAVYRGDAASVAALLDTDRHLADLAERGEYRRRVLHIAAGRGDLAVVELLLAAGASVDKQDYDGDAALHFAAAGGHLAVVRTLLAAGANTRITTNGGHSVLCAARLSKNPELIDLIATQPQPGTWAYARATSAGAAG